MAGKGAHGERLEGGGGQEFGWDPEARMKQVSGLQGKTLEEVDEN